jgi:hypothetical protein
MRYPAIPILAMVLNAVPLLAQAGVLTEATFHVTFSSRLRVGQPGSKPATPCRDSPAKPVTYRSRGYPWKPLLDPYRTHDLCPVNSALRIGPIADP